MRVKNVSGAPRYFSYIGATGKTLQSGDVSDDLVPLYHLIGRKRVLKDPQQRLARSDGGGYFAPGATIGSDRAVDNASPFTTLWSDLTNGIIEIELTGREKELIQAIDSLNAAPLPLYPVLGDISFRDGLNGLSLRLDDPDADPAAIVLTTEDGVDGARSVKLTYADDVTDSDGDMSGNGLVVVMGGSVEGGVYDLVLEYDSPADSSLRVEYEGAEPITGGFRATGNDKVTIRIYLAADAGRTVPAGGVVEITEFGVQRAEIERNSDPLPSGVEAH